MSWQYRLLATVCLAVHLGCVQAQEDVRLVNGTFGPHMGRVEVLYNGTWGTICDDFWSFSDARVACRMMGFRDAVCAITRAPFGQGTGPIWMDNLRCLGRETSLGDCPFNGWGINSCTHAEDGGMICATDDVVEPPQPPTLVGSTTTSISLQWEVPPLPEGISALRFRVQYENDEFVFPRLIIVRATLSDNKTTYNTTITRLARDTEYAVRVRTEVRYSFCFSYLFGNYSEDLTVSTNETVGPSSIQVRLVPPNPSTPFMGRLEVFHSNQWGTVCDDFFSLREAQVVCGMLNYTRALCSVPRARFGEGKDPIWMDDVRCLRGEEVLDECTFRGWGVHNCQHNDDVGVVCVPGNFPGTVAKFSITGVGSTSVSLQWERFTFPSSVSFGRYRIQYSRPGDFFPRTIAVSSTANQYTVQRLVFGASYLFTIRAEVRFSVCFAYLNGEYVDSLNATTKETEPTGPPTDFHVVVINSTAILVEWDLPLSTLRNGIIRGYKLFVQRQGGEEMTINIIGNDTDSYTVTGLLPTTAYIISALAYTVGDGPRSIHLTAFTASTDFIPFIATFGIFGDGTDRARRFTFQRGIQIFCGSGLSDATVDWFFSNGTKVGIERRDFREGHFLNGTALLDIGNGRRLILCDAGTYTCVANSSSRGIHSREFRLSINSVPPAPSRPSPTKVGSTWISITWDEPDCDGGHRVVGFDIDYREGTARFPFLGEGGTIRVENGSARNYTIRNLNTNTQYSVRIRAISADFRAGGYSINNLITTLPAAPSEPRSVTVRLVTPLIVEISWREPAVPNGHILHYTVYAIPIVAFEPERRRRQAAIDLPGIIKKIFPASSTQGNITVPDHSVTYQFQVTASVYLGGQENEGNFSVITPESTIHIPKPGLPIPRNVRVVNAGNTSVTLLWDYPPPPGEPIINFKITYAGAVASLDEEYGERTSTSTRITVSPLTPDTTYQFRVSAITQQGQGQEVTIYGTTAMPEGAKLAFFHIRIGPVQDCLEWHDDSDRIGEIQSSLLAILSSQCQCDLTTAHVTNDELSCRGGLMNQIVYRARILGTSDYSASALVDLMQSWVDGGQASVNVGFSRLQVDPTCPVSLDNLLAPDCPLLPTEPTATSTSVIVTSPSTSEPPTSPSTPPRVSKEEVSAGEIGGIIVGVVIAVLLLVVIILLVGLVVKYWSSGRTGSLFSIFRKKEEDRTPFADIGEGTHHDSGVFESDSGLKEKPTTIL